MRPSVMPPSPYAYSSLAFHAPQPQYFPFADHQDYSMHNDHSMQPPPSPGIPIDPALALYPPYYSTYQHHPPPIPQHLSIPPNYSSPSSQGSDTIGTPPTEHMYPSSASANMNGKRPASSISNDSRKKPRKDDESDVHSPAADKEEVKAKPTRGSRACTVCRRLKMKCVGAEQGPPCKRCQSGNHECIFEESNRGKRSSKKHEILTRSLRKMERTLDTVLRSIGNPSIASGMISRSPSPPAQAAGTQALLSGTTPSPPASTSASAFHQQQPQQQSQKLHHQPGSPKLHSLPDNALNPLGLLAEASLANRRAQAINPTGMVARPTNGENLKVGVASDNYFKPGPMTILPLRRLYIERQVQPEMLSFVSTEEVVELFNIYFDNIHMHCNLLDRNFHTPSLVCSRSPFLLTTICSIASKFYTAKPDLHPRLTELAKRLAFSVPAKGYKSVEIVQAYLLLALWGCGAVERYEQDKTWMLLGMAIRMATDLNLHRKTAVTSPDTTEGRARDVEIHNRERTWILCFCLDRSFSAQMGKPSCIKEDYIIKHTHDWYTSPVANPSDASLAAYCELQRILSRSLEFLYSGTDSPSGLQVQCDYMLVIKTFETQILAWSQEWFEERSWIGGFEASTPMEYKHMMSQFYLNYSLLVLNSFGLQNALDRNPVDIGHFFARVHSAAHACATIVRDQLGPSGYMKYSPDSHFVQTSYAVLSLLKLVRPEFQAFLDNEQETLTLVRDVADVLDDIAANPLHTPALYSGFLRALISAKLDQTASGSGTDGGNGEQNSGLSADAGQNGELSNTNTSGLTFSSHQQHQQQHMSSSSSSSSVVGGHFNLQDPSFLLNEFQFDSEMGPVADMSTFPPTMAPNPTEDSMGMMLTMENILSSGYNSMDGLSGGFVFGAGGSGLITPRFGGSPAQSGSNTPGRAGLLGQSTALTQTSINAAFDNSRKEAGIKIDT
ncbi:fungal-specific transcription factor domain-containing protein [Gymnopilus junonius]|uniref:Fungal-specific transcription factor domain-containing protein n=1 Tax=Gymnopilus junonius TaxID=109634 RepID=A0A9P5NZP2_GYMJU|nr:fungal-specific transcription factor domain-containing protein [Gymnopilus junonius]